MRAWLSAETLGVGGLEVVERPMPEPGEGELLLKVGAAALNYSDLLMIDDAYQVRPPRPFVPGQEVAGTVVASGPGTQVAKGTQVASKVHWGGFAEYAIARADMVFPVPEGLTLTTAAALPVVYPTAIVALAECARLRPGERVLVHAAAGGVGLASVQFAKALGAYVLATAGDDKKCKVALANGADLAFNYARDGWVKAVREATEGQGVDVIVDSVGGDVTRDSLRCLAWDGRLLIVGFSSGSIPEIPANRLLLRRASAIGVYWSHDRDAAMIARVTEKLIELCADGRLRPVIGATHAFDDLPLALTEMGARSSVGKSVLAMDRG